MGTSARDKARDQHEKRRVDTPAPAAGTPIKEIKFTLGATGRPNIAHDHGFLDDGTGKLDNSKRRAPTAADRLLLAKWIAMLEGAETFRPDLTDGTTAYRHFLLGNGTSRACNYERFVENDSSGTRVLNSAIEDTMAAALRFCMQRMPKSPGLLLALGCAALLVGCDGCERSGSSAAKPPAVDAKQPSMEIRTDCNALARILNVPAGTRACRWSRLPRGNPGMGPSDYVLHVYLLVSGKFIRLPF